MLRDKNLVPLSRQHQHALALCLRIDRAVQAGEVDVKAWQEEIHQIFEQEIGTHFDAEEKELFPAAARFTELQALVRELLAEHALLRSQFAQAAQGNLDPAGLHKFAEMLATHIRKEERQLFEAMQRLMKPEELATLGTHLDERLVSNACRLPNEVTQLRARSKISR